MTKNQTKQDALLDELLGGCSSTEEILGEHGLLKQLQKRLLERELEAELTEHLGYQRNGRRGAGTNSRNGKSKKRVQSDSSPGYPSHPPEKSKACGADGPQIKSTAAGRDSRWPDRFSSTNLFGVGNSRSRCGLEPGRCPDHRPRAGGPAPAASGTLRGEVDDRRRRRPHPYAIGTHGGERLAASQHQAASTPPRRPRAPTRPGPIDPPMARRLACGQPRNAVALASRPIQDRLETKVPAPWSVSRSDSRRRSSRSSRRWPRTTCSGAQNASEASC